MNLAKVATFGQTFEMTFEDLTKSCAFWLKTDRNRPPKAQHLPGFARWCSLFSVATANTSKWILCMFLAAWLQQHQPPLRPQEAVFHADDHGQGQRDQAQSDWETRWVGGLRL